MEAGWVKNSVSVHQSSCLLYIGRKECRGTLFSVHYKGNDSVILSTPALEAVLLKLGKYTSEACSRVGTHWNKLSENRAKSRGVGRRSFTRLWHYFQHGVMRT